MVKVVRWDCTKTPRGNGCNSSMDPILFLAAYISHICHVLFSEIQLNYFLITCKL